MRLTTLPGIADAAASDIAPVPVIAWCNRPIEKTRANKSIDVASTVAPSDAT